jgi:hypothetical protein
MRQAIPYIVAMILIGLAVWFAVGSPHASRSIVPAQFCRRFDPVQRLLNAAEKPFQQTNRSI